MFEGIAEIIGSTLESEYDPAQLIKIVRTEADNGDISEVPTPHDCFIHEVARSEAYRRSAGLADDQVEVIILALHLNGVEVDTDDQLTADGRQWKVVRAKLDGPESQWKAICKEMNGG